MRKLKTILAALLMLCCTTISAHNFEVDGIFYNILSKENKTVKVTYKGSYSSEYSREYSGNVVIPANVTYEGTTYSVTTIGESAFYLCYGFTSIEIPNSVTTIGNYAFYGCSRLTSIVVAEDNTIYDSREDCNAIIETATNTLIQGCKNTVISNSVTTIGNYAFDGCTGLTSIEIPNSVTTIGYDAFYYCTGLTSIEIPNSVTTIGDYAFYYCTGLTSIEIPNSVTTIGYAAFASCSSLTSITSHIPAEKLFAPVRNTFNGVDKNACTLYVPYGAKETYTATEGWNEFTNIVEMKGYDLTVSAAGYATLYLDFNAEFPEGVEVYTASTVDGNRLMMQQVTGILPTNTGVIVRAEQGTYTFTQSNDEVYAIENNLLRGSVEDEYITPAKDTKYYVLSMKDGIVGMYEDALTGGTFKNNAHKAYLVLGEKNLGIYDEEVDTENPGMQLSNSYYFDFSGTTAIAPVVTEIEENVYYDLSGRRVKNPAQGIYIVNGKKVLVK